MNGFGTGGEHPLRQFALLPGAASGFVHDGLDLGGFTGNGKTGLAHVADHLPHLVGKVVEAFRQGAEFVPGQQGKVAGEVPFTPGDFIEDISDGAHRAHDQMAQIGNLGNAEKQDDHRQPDHGVEPGAEGIRNLLGGVRRKGGCGDGRFDKAFLVQVDREVKQGEQRQ